MPSHQGGELRGPQPITQLLKFSLLILPRSVSPRRHPPFLLILDHVIPLPTNPRPPASDHKSYVPLEVQEAVFHWVLEPAISRIGKSKTLQ